MTIEESELREIAEKWRHEAGLLEGRLAVARRDAERWQRLVEFARHWGHVVLSDLGPKATPRWVVSARYASSDSGEVLGDGPTAVEAIDAAIAEWYSDEGEGLQGPAVSCANGEHARVEGGTSCIYCGCPL